MISKRFLAELLRQSGRSGGPPHMSQYTERAILPKILLILFPQFLSNSSSRSTIYVLFTTNALAAKRLI